MEPQIDAVDIGVGEQIRVLGWICPQCDDKKVACDLCAKACDDHAEWCGDLTATSVL